MNFRWLSSMKGTPVAVAWCRVQEIRERPCVDAPSAHTYNHCWPCDCLGPCLFFAFAARCAGQVTALQMRMRGPASEGPLSAERRGRSGFKDQKEFCIPMK